MRWSTLFDIVLLILALPSKKLWEKKSSHALNPITVEPGKSCVMLHGTHMGFHRCIKRVLCCLECFMQLARVLCVLQVPFHNIRRFPCTKTPEWQHNTCIVLQVRHARSSPWTFSSVRLQIVSRRSGLICYCVIFDNNP